MLIWRNRKLKPVVRERILGLLDNYDSNLCSIKRHKSVGRSLRTRRVNANSKSNDRTKRSSFQFTASKTNNLWTFVLQYEKTLLLEE